jgi:thiamine pyrophosphate-dependent acetolactate synthase large subunit-like protein
MVMGDFLTAVKNKLPIKVFVFNNKQLGMIMQEQKIENYPSWQTDLFDFNFANYAKNCGATGIRVAEPTKLEEAVKTALVTQGPAIVDIETDPKRFG